jgi:hypothetical protein
VFNTELVIHQERFKDETSDNMEYTEVDEPNGITKHDLVLQKDLEVLQKSYLGLADEMRRRVFGSLFSSTQNIASNIRTQSIIHSSRQCGFTNRRSLKQCPNSARPKLEYCIEHARYEPKSNMIGRISSTEIKRHNTEKNNKTVQQYLQQ